MLKLFLSRFLQAVVVLLGVVTVVFFVLRLVPGDPARVIAPTASPAAQEQVRQELGLNDPIALQYVNYLGDVLKGDFGNSYFFSGSTANLIFTALPYTVNLVIVALVIGVVFSVPLGAYASLRKRRLADRAVLGLSITAQSTPNFLIALIGLTVLAPLLSLPTVGYVGPISLLLPSMALGISLIGVMTQTIRNNLTQTLDSPLAEALRSRGASWRHIIRRHGARLATVSVTNLIGIQIGFLLGGAVIIEFIFNYPGLGLLTLNAVLRRDYPLIQAITVTTALIFIVLNLLIDISHGIIDPRIRASTGRRA